MKKTFSRFLASLALVFVASTAMAGNSSVTLQPVAEALQARELALQPKASAYGKDTLILVINYDDPRGIQVFFPTGKVNVMQRTSARYKNENYTGTTPIVIFNADNKLIWQGSAQYEDIISVYFVNGQYTTYVTH